MITNASWLARIGDLLRQHARTIRLIQWLVVGFYLVLLLVPAMLTLPPSEARMLDNITVFAQFLFWGCGGRSCCCRWCCSAGSGAACSARKARSANGSVGGG